MMHRLERLGIKPGETFDLSAAQPALKAAFEEGIRQGKAELLKLNEDVSDSSAQGWRYSTESGAYGVNYRYRAGVAVAALGENLASDAVYPSTATDSSGQPLDGSHSYVLHFPKGELPPVDAFWSVTAYDKDGGYFIPNALKRQALGDRNKLILNEDSSLDIDIQAQSPGSAKEANWLPVANAPFTLLLRLYSPRDAILEGRWIPPQVKRLD